jgi:hypothetical protein
MLEFTASEYLDDRTALVDGDPDSLWSDAQLVRYFNHGARILARRAWCIKETGIAPAGTIVLQTGKVLYPLHRSILFVHDATPTTQTAPLGRASDRDLRTPYPLGMDALEQGMAASINGADTYTGAPLAFAPDPATRTLRVYPAPSATQNGLRVLLQVSRLPINELTLDDTDAAPEIPEEYHEDLCLYAAGRCLTQPMVDSGYKADGRNLLAEFNDTCREARRDRQRAEYSGSRWGFASTTAYI